jgi:hypothetical protein
LAASGGFFDIVIFAQQNNCPCPSELYSFSFYKQIQLGNMKKAERQYFHLYDDDN